MGHFCFIKGKRCRAAKIWASWPLVFLDPDQQIKRWFILTLGALLLLLFSELLGSTKPLWQFGEWRSRALCHCCRRSTTLTALVVIMTGRGTSKRVCLTRSSRISGWSALLLYVWILPSQPLFISWYYRKDFIFFLSSFLKAARALPDIYKYRRRDFIFSFACPQNFWGNWVVRYLDNISREGYHSP